MEDYPEAIRLHKMVISRNPDNALAHYHLGFAYGMIGKHDEELRQYRDAVELGLSDWALFLNLGLLYLESQRLPAATDVLRLATLLGPTVRKPISTLDWSMKGGACSVPPSRKFCCPCAWMPTNLMRSIPWE